MFGVFFFWLFRKDAKLLAAGRRPASGGATASILWNAYGSSAIWACRSWLCFVDWRGSCRIQWSMPNSFFTKAKQKIKAQADLSIRYPSEMGSAVCQSGPACKVGRPAHVFFYLFVSGTFLSGKIQCLVPEARKVQRCGSIGYQNKMQAMRRKTINHPKPHKKREQRTTEFVCSILVLSALVFIKKVGQPREKRSSNQTSSLGLSI